MGKKIGKFEHLTVWQKAHALVLKIYKITRNFPRDERFGLVSQMRRSAVSIAANIAEGFKRRGIKDKINFYNISQSSLNELQYYMILIEDLKYINHLGELNEINSFIEEIGKMLNGLVSSVNKIPKT